MMSITGANTEQPTYVREPHPSHGRGCQRAARHWIEGRGGSQTVLGTGIDYCSFPNQQMVYFRYYISIFLN